MERALAFEFSGPVLLEPNLSDFSRHRGARDAMIAIVEKYGTTSLTYRFD